MEEYVSTIVKIIIRFFMHMRPSGWLITMLIVTALGMLALQGFGSRAKN